MQYRDEDYSNWGRPPRRPEPPAAMNWEGNPFVGFLWGAGRFWRQELGDAKRRYREYLGSNQEGQ